LQRAGGAVPRRVGAVALLLSLAAALGTVTVLVLQWVHRPAWTLVGGAVALLGVLALAVARYDAAVVLGLLLFAIVRVEPAPADVIFAVVIMVAIATGRFGLRDVPMWPGLLVAAFIALNILACMEAVDPRRAAAFCSITVYLLVFGLWVATWVVDRSRARTLVRIYVGIAVASAVVGSLALFVSLPGHDVLTAYQGTRPRALFKDPNVYGPFLVPAALILLHEIVHPMLLRSRRLVNVAALAVVGCGILFSYSRAAWLNAAVGALVMGIVLTLRRSGARQGLVFASILGLTALTLVVAINASGQMTFLRERTRLQPYDSQRFSAQSAGVALGERHPIGIGPGQFERYEPISAHSTYVRAFAEEGPLGLLLIAGIMVGTLVLALRNAVGSRDTVGIASTVLLASWCGILANSVFVDTLHWRHLWLVAGLIWAAAAAQASSYRAGRSAT
jgi:hypothetical protein